MAYHRTIGIAFAVLTAAVLASAKAADSIASDAAKPADQASGQTPDDIAKQPIFDNLEGRRTGLPTGGLQCVFFHSIYDWRAIDRYNLILWAPNRSSPYLVALDRPCDGLLFTDTVAFSSNLDGRLCAFGGDAVVVDHDRCPIGAINKLTKEQLDYVLTQQRGRKKQDDDKKKDK
jgi:hypothetical protein